MGIYLAIPGLPCWRNLHRKNSICLALWITPQTVPLKSRLIKTQSEHTRGAAALWTNIGSQNGWINEKMIKSVGVGWVLISWGNQGHYRQGNSAAANKAGKIIKENDDRLNAFHVTCACPLYLLITFLDLLPVKPAANSVPFITTGSHFRQMSAY